MSARTIVGSTRKKSEMRIRTRVDPAADEARDDPDAATPMTIVIIVAMSPMVIEIRAPWTVRLSTSRPSSSVPNR